MDRLDRGEGVNDRLGPNPVRLNDIVLATERLELAAPSASDAAALFALVGGDERETICRYLLWDGPDGLDDVLEWAERSRSQTFGENGFNWAIRDRFGSFATAGAALGTIGIETTGPPGRIGVGYWLGVEYWRRGIMREALRAVIDLVFGDLACNKLEAEVFTFNQASRALVESLGFTLEGVARQNVRKGDAWVDDARYGLLRHDWEQRRAT